MFWDLSNKYKNNSHLLPHYLVWSEVEVMETLQTLEWFTRKKIKKPTKTIHFHHLCRVLLQEQNPCFRIISSISETRNPSRRLSPTTALSEAAESSLSSTETPDPIITLFLDNGLTEAQIRKVLSKRPVIRLSDPDKLQPKLEFFKGLGVSDLDIGKLLATDPSILSMSLENHIIPNFNFLKSYVGTNENVWRVLSRSTWVLRINTLTVMEPNITILRNHGVPDGNISKLLFSYPQVLAKNTVKFEEIVEKVEEVGFNASSLMFCHAVRALASLTESNLDKKMLLFQSFGWSEDEVLSLFRKQPLILTLSEKKIEKGLKFFFEKMKFTLEEISLRPTLLLYSLEGRMIPRCRLLKILMSKGVSVKLGPALLLAEKQFMAKYVVKYQESIPEVLKVYKGGTD